jgi:hypothetical protein
MPGGSDQSIYSSYLEDNAAGGGFGNSPVLVIHHLFLVKAGPKKLCTAKCMSSKHK